VRRGLATAVILTTLTVLAACGGGRAPATPTTTLDAVTRLAILEQVVAAALGGVAPHAPAARAVDGSLATVSCEKSCDAANCVVTCPIDERLSCLHGGSATNRGTIQGTLDADQTGGASLEARQGYHDCRPSSELTVNGDPETMARGTAHFARGQVAEQQTVRIQGAVRYAASDGSGRCEVDLSVRFSPDLHGSARGTACTQPVDVAF
jgi:hypothetical protein